MWPSALVPCLVLAVIFPAPALTLEGTAKGAGGSSVRVVIKLDRDQPKTVDLDYAPTRVPSNHSETFGSPTTYNGVDGSEYIELNDQSETVTSHLHFFGWKPPGPGNARRELKGKVRRDELAILQWSGTTTYFSPAAGGASLVIARNSTPQSETRNFRGQNVATGRIGPSTGKQISWRFISDDTEGSYSSVAEVRITLRRVNAKKWRIRISTGREYFDYDVEKFVGTIESGFLRVR